MRRNEVQNVAIPAVNVSKLGVANADGIFQHGRKHGLKIARRTADNLKHLRRCRLLLQRFVQLAGEASDISVLASSGRSATGPGLRRNAALQLCLPAASPFNCCAPCCEALSHCLLWLKHSLVVEIGCQAVQLIEQRLGLLQIEGVEPSVNQP